MNGIIIFTLIFEILSFIMMLTLSRIIYKIICVKNKCATFESKSKQDIILLIMFIIFIISSITGLLNKGLILPILYTGYIVFVIAYSIIKKDKYISCFLTIYSLFNLILAIVGLIINFDINNIFDAYIITIALSPLSFTKGISFCYIIIFSTIILFNFAYIKFFNNKIK